MLGQPDKINSLVLYSILKYIVTLHRSKYMWFTCAVLCKVTNLSGGVVKNLKPLETHVV